MRSFRVKPVGWRGESYRHYLAAKGVKTKHDYIKGGLADGRPSSDFDPKQIKKGIKVEMEHTDDPRIAEEIARDHLSEDPKYYDHLAEMERKYMAHKYFYTPTYVAGDLPLIAGDALGTAGAATVSWIPTLVPLALLYGGASYAVKRKKERAKQGKGFFADKGDDFRAKYREVMEMRVDEDSSLPEIMDELKRHQREYKTEVMYYNDPDFYNKATPDILERWEIGMDERRRMISELKDLARMKSDKISPPE